MPDVYHTDKVTAEILAGIRAALADILQTAEQIRTTDGGADG